MSSTNGIPEKQNDDDSIELLAAVSQFYGYAKITMAVQVVLTILLPVTASVFTLFSPNFKIWATFIGVTVTWLDVLLIDRIQIHFRKRGALLQEQFDLHLFDLPWNELRVGKQIETEEIHRAAARFLKSTSAEKLHNWYPSSIGDLPLGTARIVCQRACLWWDTSQRRQYGYWLTGIVSSAILTLWTFSFAKGLSLTDLTLSVYAPIAPAIIWAIREARRQKDASDGLEKARTFVDSVIKRLRCKNIQDEELFTLTRQIQDTLFDNRSKNPLIFDWIYHLLRSEREVAMTKAAAKFTSELL